MKLKCPVAVWMDYYDDLSAEKAIARLAKAGFTHSELSLTHLKQLKNRNHPAEAGKFLRQAADGEGFSVSQGHLSFLGGLCDDSAMERLMPELEMFAAAGIQKAILHLNGGKDLSDEERYDRWIGYVRKLSEFVEGTGVTLCLENMYSIAQCRSVSQLKTVIRDAGGKNLAICLDTGHLHLSRAYQLTEDTHRSFILEAGDLLQAMHITENNGIGDTHQMPFSSRYGIDWVEVMTALRELDYKWLFNLEVLGERIAPLPIRDAKLTYLRAMSNYLISEEFLTDPYEYLPFDKR